MASETQKNAKKFKNDEFYTQYQDIQKEVNAYLDYNKDVFKNKTILLPCDDPEWSDFTKFFAQNFQRFGLKKLISTSYAFNSKNVDFDYQPTLFETVDPRFEINKSKAKGKIFTLTADENSDGKINIDDLKWNYLEGDGDFRSEEIKKLRSEADIVITNPPFSLFREFIEWIYEDDKKFLVIGNLNAISYKEIFSKIKDNELWLGATNFNTGMYFRVPENFKYAPTYKFEREINGIKVNRVPGVCWFTNIEHGKRHNPLPLMTEADNKKFSKHKEIKGVGYQKYDNYDAIEVPFSDAIPSDFNGNMGVPITFLDKYCPEQFEIIGQTDRDNSSGLRTKVYTENDCKNYNDLNRASVITKNGELCVTYMRILIKRREQNDN